MGVLDKFSLKDRIALVSGGAGPMFGSSISEALVEAGATVIAASRSLERNQKFAERLKSQGYEAHAMQVDIADPESIGALQVRVAERFGRLDILVNSSVVGGVTGFEEQEVRHWEHSAQANMVGLFAMCRGFIPGMVEQGRGSVINISSIYGVVGNDPTLYEGTDMKQPPDYNFVKAGMINFTRYLANYYGKQGIRSNCISPGGYFDNQPDAFVDEYTRRVPIGRMLDNEDIKGAVVYLASDASEYVNGHNLLVDGGWTAV